MAEPVCDNCGAPWHSTDGRCVLCRKGAPAQQAMTPTPEREAMLLLADEYEATGYGADRAYADWLRAGCPADPDQEPPDEIFLRAITKALTRSPSTTEEGVGEEEVERLTSAIITWFDNRTGFHVRDPDSDEDRNLLSAYYGGHWVEFRADKLAEHIANYALSALRRPPCREEVLEEAARVADEYAVDQFARALQHLGSNKIKSETASEHIAASNIAARIRALKTTQQSRGDDDA